MDPGGSDLESSLPQAENPCLIVEDSQPDSVALEDDPDTSYRALLARRLSNLQPTSHSPVLELISSPSKGQCSESDSQTEKSNNVSQTDNFQANPSSAAEHSQVFAICSLPKIKRSYQENMNTGADSTTNCAQTEGGITEEGMSHFGLLELSESQGVFDESQNSDDKDVEVTPANLQTDIQKPASQSGFKSSFRAPDSQDGRSKRSEVSSSSPSVSQKKEDRELSVQAILHSQVSESKEDEDEEIMSSQDDLFDGERNGSKVDSTVAELETQPQQPTSTPAHSLHLLHLSGQGTLVQESLSQQSVDFVAATQDGLSQTPLIIPNSPTAQENELETTKDQKKGHNEPLGVVPVLKSAVSQNLSSSALEKTLLLPTQPELSHDVFVPTPSLESGSSSQGQDAPKKMESPSTSVDAEGFKKPSDSHPTDVATSFQLELDSENSVFDKKTQVFTVDEDSQATQIEETEGTIKMGEKDSVPVCNSAKDNKSGADSGLIKMDHSQEILQGSKLKPEQADDKCSSQKTPSHSASVTETISKSQETPCISNTSMSQKICVIDLTSSSSSQNEESSGRLSGTTSQSQSVILGDECEGVTKQKLSQPMSHSHKLDSISNTTEKDGKEDHKMDEDEIQSTSKTEGSGLGLALSLTQVDSPEPMEVGEEPADSDKEESFGVMVLEESQRVSQEKAQRSQTFKSSSQPVKSSPKENFEYGRKLMGSQPSSSGQVPKKFRQQNPEASDEAIMANKSLSDSSGDLPFNFTLPKEGDLIGPAASATPPHVRQLKNTPLHSTPIAEISPFLERPDANSSRETTIASEISVEESGEREEPNTKGTDSKLSLRMKVVSPVQDGSLGSEQFSLQKPSLPDEESSVSKATTSVAKAVTSPQSVFTRVREVHRQLQVEDEKESSSLSVRPPSQTDHPNSENSGLLPVRPLEAVDNGTADRASQQPNGTASHSERLVEGQTSERTEHEAPSTSGQALSKSPTGKRAVSQQTSVDLSSTTSPLSKRAVSQQTSFDASGPQIQLGRGEPVTPTRSQSGPFHRRHVRTIQEVRTTITRIITDVYYEDGKEVDRKVVEESDEPVVDRCVMDSDVSPSRTASSMTSGDLADMSSLSSKAASHFSSSGTSSGGPAPGRITGFVMPPSRGGKIGSPRRGGKQAVGSELASGWGPTISPRGHGRRGRPPSRSPSSRGGKSGQRGGPHGPTVSSSEDELPSNSKARISSSRLDTLNTTSPENSSGSNSSFVGLRVMAKWSSNSLFYSGTITRDLGENHFGLLFDDNQECEVQGRDILLCDPIPIETEVTALTEEEFFNTGLVKGYKRQGTEFLYSVEKDGKSLWYSRTAVILTMEQGNRLREQYGLGPYEPSTPQSMASDISLDNLMEGKRRRRGNGAGPGTPSSSSTNSPKTPAKRKLASSTEDERTPTKRGRKGAGARPGLRMAACNTSGSGAELPPDPNDLLVTHGPVPESTSLFMGFVFMLTTSSENDKESNQTSDGDEEYVQVAPYNKQYTETQLEAGGGMILPEFNEEQCKAAYQSILIADQHCRTQTYLLCIAGGVPCVSQIWVRDSCQEKKLMNYRNYLLPAGLGPEKRIMEWHARCNPFKALKVLLVSEDRKDLWTALLTICGAAKVQQHNSNSSNAPEQKFDVVVSASSCPADVLKSAKDAGTPVVSLEWLVQCVICGERQAYDSQPEYHLNYSS
ncbi:TP53-binding protein 1 [Trichomycterus rosablanca]|uniref:TP53-binding protein 1 n=1 Tax=Trichomycterus rosablanca TaxID=2290929 RepID=UPI002F3594D5